MNLRRRPGLASVALVAVAVAWALSASLADAAPPRAQLTQFACTRALDPANRSLSVQAVTRPLPQTRKLGVKFDLLARSPGAGASTLVRGPGLSVWITPTNPTLGQLSGDVWRLNKRVLNLAAPATYRFRVTFRWTGAHGRVLGTAVKLSATCRQQELRPDLLVSSIAVSPVAGHPDTSLYTAVIADRGATGAGPFEVLFAPGDTSGPTIDTVPFLGAGQSEQLSFVGPACDPASPPTVTVDATSVVDDDNRANNTLSATCAASTGSRPTLESIRR
ncbi:MAG: CARDB domain-containing protein [Solirubrobacteraceae bacterium]